MQKHKFKIKLLPGEELVWVGRQWAVTTRGMEMIRPPFTWVSADLIPKGMTGTTFMKHGATLSCLAGSWYMDIEDLIDAYTVACKTFAVPTQFLAEAAAYARKRHAASIGDYPALMPDVWRAANPLALSTPPQLNYTPEQLAKVPVMFSYDFAGDKIVETVERTHGEMMAAVVKSMRRPVK